MDGTLTLEIQNQIGTITFSHSAANSLSPEMLDDFCELLRETDNNPEAKVIVIQSDGDRAFCGGASLSALKKGRYTGIQYSFFYGFCSFDQPLKKMLQVCHRSGSRQGGRWWNWFSRRM